MKKINLLFATIVLAISGLFAQTPQQFKYQAVLRDASGVILASQAVDVNVAILKGSATGTEVFSEDHAVTSTAQGLININVGETEDLSVISWEDDTYFVKISVDGTEMGTSQLLSVPYAVNAKSAENAHWIKNVSNSIYYGEDVGIGNSAPEAKLHVTGGAKFGAEGVVIDEILELTGTTPASGVIMHIDYPAGYTNINCRVLSAEVAYMGLTWMNGKSRVGTGLASTQIYLYFEELSTYWNKPYRIVLMKVQ